MFLREIKNTARSKLSPAQVARANQLYGRLIAILPRLLTPCSKYIATPIKLAANSKNEDRKLEIGPGHKRIEGFETVNAIWSPCTDYVVNASGRLPFASNIFEIVYASHILEHIPWYQLEATLKEWVRILRVGGAIEVWVPNGLLIAETFVKAEIEGVDESSNDGWYKFNPDRDPCVWVNGRIFSYGDGKGGKTSPNWHLSMFSPRYLKRIMERAGLVDVHEMTVSEVRGHDHGWINLGMKGKKP